MTEWLFLTNHALVLSYIAHHPRITAREIADEVGITERATHRIITDLEEAGYITRKREGRRNRYRVNADLPMRHPTYREKVVGDLLQSLGWKRRPKRKDCD